MKTQNEVRSRAEKIAARLQSPYPHEVEVASSMLRNLLAEHNMSMRDLGMGSTDVVVSRTAAPSSERFSPRNEFEDIMDINYKKVYSALEQWERWLMTQLHLDLGIEIVMELNYVKFVGFSSNIKLLKKILPSFTRIIKDVLNTRTFSCTGARDDFAWGFIVTILGRVGISNSDRQANLAKFKVIWRYMRKNYPYFVPSMPTYSGIKNSKEYHEGIDAGRNYQMKESRPTPFTPTTVTVSKPGTPSRRF